MRAPRLHIPRPGRRRVDPRRYTDADRVAPSEYEPPLCGAVAEGEDAPISGVAGPCNLPAGRHPWHRADATQGERHFPNGWAWPNRDAS